ncbi:MAG: hypothetical protein R3Y39_04225 [Rikenellaceae bacterium]
MKKLFFPVMLLAAAMCSCTEDETNMIDYPSGDSSDLVSINVYAGTTKGTDTTTETLETKAYVELHIDDSASKALTYKFTYDGTNWNQGADDPIKWSDIVFPAKFYSLHDGSPYTNLTFTDDDATYTDYTVSGESSLHKDLVFHASEIDAIPADGTLSVYHKHALSKIHLYAATGTNKVYIARARLINMDGKGTVTITPLDDDATSTDVGASWENSGTSDSEYEYYSVESNASAISSGDGSAKIISTLTESPLMIIPQSTTAATAEQIANSKIVGTYIEVIYYLTNVNENPLVGYAKVRNLPDGEDYISTDLDRTLYVMAAFPLAHCFLPNKEYDITLGLGSEDSTGGILIEDYYVDKDGVKVTLTKKDDGSTTTPEVPDVDEGDDILDNVNSAICITVTANSWDDGIDKEIEFTE